MSVRSAVIKACVAGTVGVIMVMGAMARVGKGEVVVYGGVASSPVLGVSKLVPVLVVRSVVALIPMTGVAKGDAMVLVSSPVVGSGTAVGTAGLTVRSTPLVTSPLPFRATNV